MSLQSVCSAFNGDSNFRSPTRGSAVWFHEEGGTVRRMAWQGDSMIRALQYRLGVSQDGKWGTATNDALRRKMRQLGMDPSIVHDGAIDGAMLEAALVVLYTLGARGDDATEPAARVCLPSRVVRPQWRILSGDDGSGGNLVETILETPEGTPAPTPAPTELPWRRPAESTVVDSGTEPDGSIFLVYRILATGEVRRVTLTADGRLIEDRLATDSEIPGRPGTTPSPSTPNPALDPGTRAPGDPAPPSTTLSPQADAYSRGVPPQTSPTPAAPNSNKLIIAASVAGILLLAVVASVVSSSAPPPPPPPPPPRTRR